MIYIENNELNIEIIDTKDLQEKHFGVRYNYCGYIKQIYSKVTKKGLLGIPSDEFLPFNGEGFPDEFEMPISYEEAKVGESFIKIGVGLLEKTSQKEYTNWDMHPIKKKFPVEINRKQDEVVFHQSGGLNNEYAYNYSKAIKILKGGNFRISHVIKNSGNKTWKTLWYSHVFLPIDNSKGGGLLEVSPNCKLRKTPKFLIPNDVNGEFVLDRSIEDECINWDINPKVPNMQCFTDASKGYKYLAIGDYSYDELQAYVNKRIISPEPKVIMELKTGETFAWSTDYYIELI